MIAETLLIIGIVFVAAISILLAGTVCVVWVLTGWYRNGNKGTE